MISLKDGFEIAPYGDGDQDAFVQFLNDDTIHRNTLAIPHPYTRKDADFFLNLIEQRFRERGEHTSFALRDPKGKLVGGVGMDNLIPGQDHKGELGYWIAHPYWGQGRMTEAVGAIVLWSFHQWNLERVTAHIFAHNHASCRVVEKNGFREEGYLRKFYRKNGSLLDCRVFARLRSDLPPA